MNEMDESKRTLFGLRRKKQSCPQCGQQLESAPGSVLLLPSLAAGFIAFLFAASILAFPGLLNLFDDGSSAVAQQQQEAIVRMKDDVVAYLESEEEDVAIQALWTSIRELTIGVDANGRNFDGYAAYVCQLLNERGLGTIQDLSVDIVDLADVRENGNWRAIGRARCNPVGGLSSTAYAIPAPYGY